MTRPRRLRQRGMNVVTIISHQRAWSAQHIRYQVRWRKGPVKEQQPLPEKRAERGARVGLGERMMPRDLPQADITATDCLVNHKVYAALETCTQVARKLTSDMVQVAGTSKAAGIAGSADSDGSKQRVLFQRRLKIIQL